MSPETVPLHPPVKFNQDKKKKSPTPLSGRSDCKNIPLPSTEPERYAMDWTGPFHHLYNHENSVELDSAHFKTPVKRQSPTFHFMVLK